MILIYILLLIARYQGSTSDVYLISSYWQQSTTQ